jgi:hypothetical protein
MPRLSRRAKELLISTAASYAAVAIGWGAGMANLRRPGLDWVPALLICAALPRIMGAVAIGAFVVEFVRFMAIPRLRRAHIVAPWVCLAFGAACAGVMDAEPFVHCNDDSSFVIAVCALVPFLLAIGYFVRSGAWFAATAAAIFYATCLCMLILNARDSRGMAHGFFYSEVW